MLQIDAMTVTPASFYCDLERIGRTFELGTVIPH